MTTRIHHLNCGTLLVPTFPPVVCHCLLLEDHRGLALIDTGIGLRDVQDPVGRLGQELVDKAGFQFDERQTALRQIEQRGFSPTDVHHLILTHADPDHAGGLADFPDARVHISEEEYAHLIAGHPRYAGSQFAHGPAWKMYGHQPRPWFGLEARPLTLAFDAEVLLIPLFGHTAGHCGVAIQQGNRWLLHVGDAYYLRAELETDDHPVSLLAARRADSDVHRLESLEHLRRIHRDHANEVDLIGYHDVTEFPVL